LLLKIVCLWLQVQVEHNRRDRAENAGVELIEQIQVVWFHILGAEGHQREFVPGQIEEDVAGATATAAGDARGRLCQKSWNALQNNK